MKKDTAKPLSKVIRIDESGIHGHLDEMVKGDGRRDSERHARCRN